MRLDCNGRELLAEDSQLRAKQLLACKFQGDVIPPAKTRVRQLGEF